MKTKRKDKIAANPVALPSQHRAGFDKFRTIIEDGLRGNKGIFNASRRSCPSADGRPETTKTLPLLYSLVGGRLAVPLVSRAGQALPLHFFIAVAHARLLTDTRKP